MYNVYDKIKESIWKNIIFNLFTYVCITDENKKERIFLKKITFSFFSTRCSSKYNYPYKRGNKFKGKKRLV